MQIVAWWRGKLQVVEMSHALFRLHACINFSLQLKFQIGIFDSVTILNLTLNLFELGVSCINLHVI